MCITVYISNPFRTHVDQIIEKSICEFSRINFINFPIKYSDTTSKFTLLVSSLCVIWSMPFLGDLRGSAPAEVKWACSLCFSVTETPVPAIEAGRGRRDTAVRERRLTLLLPTLLALCWLMELCGRDGLFGVTSPLRIPMRTHPT